MANPRGNPNLTAHQFQKGCSGNPGGRPKNVLTKHKVTQVFSRMALMNMDEIEDIVKKKNHKNGKSSLEVMVAAIIGKAVAQGDHTRLNFLLDRTIGKVTDELAVSDGRFDKDFDKIPKENIIELLRSKAANE